MEAQVNAYPSFSSSLLMVQESSLMNSEPIMDLLSWDILTLLLLTVLRNMPMVMYSPTQLRAFGVISDE